ncbi:hypothetical protein CBL_13846 [Carabus blaptoides fortunei]
MLNADYNMISFDSLSRNSLLQICADCLNKLDAIPKLDVTRNTEEALTKIMEILINIRIPLSNNISVVKKRAYFSKYLNKVPVPLNISSNLDIQPLITQYEHLIQEFKVVHAVTYRSEVLQQNTLKKQIDEQSILIEQLDNQIKKLNEQLKSRQSARFAPENILGKLQEEVQTNKVIVEERLPQELEVLNKKAQLIDMVVQESAPSDDVISDVQHSIDNISLELEKMVQKHVLTNDTRDDKLAEFRQHASVIANNKRIAADRLMELKEKVSIARRLVEDRETELQQTIGGTMPQGDELKRFVSKLRARSVVYKEHRALLLEFQAEVGINSNKADIVLSRQQLQNLKKDMEELTRNHQRAKEVFNSSISNLDVEIHKLETEVNDMEKVIENEETKWKNLKNDIEVKKEILNDIEGDTADSGKEKNKSQKYILSEKITEQESVKKSLELEMQQTIAEKEDREQQVLLWYSTLELLKSKKSVITTD